MKLIKNHKIICYNLSRTGRQRQIVKRRLGLAEPTLALHVPVDVALRPEISLYIC